MTLHRLLVVEDSESDVELLREALADSEPAVELDVVRHCLAHRVCTPRRSGPA